MLIHINSNRSKPTKYWRVLSVSRFVRICRFIPTRTLYFVQISTSDCHDNYDQTEYSLLQLVFWIWIVSINCWCRLTGFDLFYGISKRVFFVLLHFTVNLLAFNCGNLEWRLICGFNTYGWMYICSECMFCIYIVPTLPICFQRVEQNGGQSYTFD